MKGLKLGLLGVCVCLTGIALSTNNDGALAAAFFGDVLAFGALFVKD